MKIFVVLAAFIAVSFSAENEPTNLVKELERDLKSTRDMTATVNDYADKIFTNLQQLLIEQGMDPMALPDQHASFSYKLLLITYHGELDLTKGWLQNIATLHRSGNVIVQYKPATNKMSVTIPMTFNDLMFAYDYKAMIMNLGPIGGIEGKVTDINVEVTIGFDFETYHASLDSFNLPDTGKVTFHFTGNALVDWLLNILTNLITTIVKGVVMVIIESVIRGGLNSVVDTINDTVDGIFHPTTTTTAPLPLNLS